MKRRQVPTYLSTLREINVERLIPYKFLFHLTLCIYHTVVLLVEILSQNV